MICYNSRAADMHAHQLGLEAAHEDALVEECNNALAEVPEQVAEVIRHWIGMNQEFAEAIDAALEQIIAARNAP